jgi:hypothetical protein
VIELGVKIIHSLVSTGREVTVNFSDDDVTENLAQFVRVFGLHLEVNGHRICHKLRSNEEERQT